MIVDPRARAKARKKYEEEKQKEFTERTGIRDESKDWTIERCEQRYDFDMAERAAMSSEERKKDRKMKAEQMLNIDPYTGKPREGPKKELDNNWTDADFSEDESI